MDGLLPEDVGNVRNEERKGEEDEKDVSLSLDTDVLLISGTYCIVETVHGGVVKRVSEHAEQGLHALSDHVTPQSSLRLTTLGH